MEQDEPTLEQLNEKLDEIIDEKYEEFFDKNQGRDRLFFMQYSRTSN